MRTPRTRLFIPLLVTFLATVSCGSGDDVTSGTSVQLSATSLVNSATGSATTAAPATSTVAPSAATSTGTPAITVAPATNPPKLRKISLTVGTDSSPTRVEKVPLGFDVTLSMINPTQDDEFHLHGYDLTQAAGPGEAAVFSFVADIAGRFDLESHRAKGVLLVIEVS